MFGYVIANLPDLDDQEKARYQGAYCGLCRTLGERLGQRCRPLLSYDTTFLSLLLGALYEPAESGGQARCALHPVAPRSHLENPYTAYAADMTVALAYHKCLDDWHDDHNLRHRGYAGLLERPYAQVRCRHPYQTKAIEAGLARIDAGEHDPATGPDQQAAAFGAVMAAVFVPYPDIWADTLAEFGYELGRFIYLMDATCDYADDLKHGSYNPLRLLGCQPEQMEPTLECLIGAAAAAFERLPLERDLHLLRSVLYAGVWQQFNSRYKAGAASVPAEEAPPSTVTVAKRRLARSPKSRRAA
jgi:hypothetical protein